MRSVTFLKLVADSLTLVCIQYFCFTKTGSSKLLLCLLKAIYEVALF